MKKAMLLAGVAVLVGTATWAQPRITSFRSDGELTWTNFVRVGAYQVGCANQPGGPWNLLSTATNSNWLLAMTNRVTVQVPVSNAPTFYRVGWWPPNPVGTWDYRGYDVQGTLLLTGWLSLTSTNLVATNPPVCRVSGWKDLQYAGPPTNQLGQLIDYLGAGEFGGSLYFRDARLDLMWPPNCWDCGMIPLGTLWPNTYTGRWYYQDFVGRILGGAFSAERR